MTMLACQDERPNILSVSTLSALIKGHVEDAFLQVNVQGEVSMPKLHTSGHLYFSLKDSCSVMDAVCWRPSALRLKNLLSHGTQVICQGKITTYAGRSKYQMIVSDVSVVGEGDLFRLLEARKKQLTQEGLFDEVRKKPLPPFPKCIGLITSPTGAVIQDIVHRLEERFPLKVLLYPVSVQGEGALASLVEAIDVLSQTRIGTASLDLIILARGGGSFEDLFVFNDEQLVRAIARCSVPLVSAIGHETDTTLADYVADQRAPTPTAAAELATPHRSSLKEALVLLEKRLQKSWQRISHPQLMHAGFMTKRLQRSCSFLILHTQRLDELEGRLRLCTQFLHYKAQSLRGVSQRIRTPQVLWEDCTVSFQLSQRKLKKVMQSIWHRRQEILGIFISRLELTSYKKTLARGFCLAISEDDNVLTSVLQGEEATRMRLLFHDGSLSVRKT